MMWLRMGAAVVVTVLVLGGLQYLGLGGVRGGRGGDEHDAAHRSRELFWFLIFAVVMATAVLAAARRWREHLRHAMVPARRRPRP
jgi:hypothetical protein